MRAQEKVRAKLELQLETVRTRVEKIRRDLERKSVPLEKDWEEAAVTRENDEVLEGLEREGLVQIASLQEALKRVAEGTYGMCVKCGGRIAPARLEVLPHAVACIECAKGMEGKG